MNNRVALRQALLCATILAAIAPLAAHAAEGGAEAPAAPEATTNEQTIVVTATRRSTSLQDVPINISAVSSQALQDQHIDDVHGLGAVTPGLTIKDNGPSGNGTIIMRGLSANDTSSSGNQYDNSLAIYLGETPIYADFKFMDIARAAGHALWRRHAGRRDPIPAQPAQPRQVGRHRQHAHVRRKPCAFTGGFG